jgi:hypothetical protein
LKEDELELDPDTSPEATLDCCCLEECSTADLIEANREIKLYDYIGDECDPCEGAVL